MESQRPNVPTSDALAAAARGREALAARVVAPLWYLVAVGVAVAQHVLVQGVENLNWTLPSAALLVAGCAAAWLVWRHQMGVTIYPAAGWRSLLALGAWSISAFLSTWAAAASRDWAIVIGLALVALGASVVLGRAWAAALRDDVTHPGRWTT